MVPVLSELMFALNWKHYQSSNASEGVFVSPFRSVCQRGVFVLPFRSVYERRTECENGRMSESKCTASHLPV